MRAFCQGLRDWDKTFMETDFKFTDDFPAEKLFQHLSLRKVGELVAYGLEGAVAPSLSKSAGTHLEATEYHEMLRTGGKDTVVIDVRNRYESAIGHFAPPTESGGARLLDPKLRNSREFQRW